MLKKVRLEIVTLWVQSTDQTFTTIINWNFAQKGATQKVWPFRSSWQTKPSQLYIGRNFAQKVRRRKCDLWGPEDRPNLHNYILIEIFIKKVRRRKCDPISSFDNLHNYISINRNFRQKSGTKKCELLGPVDKPNIHNYYQ